MALPVATRTYPYHPGTPFTMDEIWGRPSPAPQEVPISGSTEETKSRLRNVLASTAETALTYLQQRVRPGGPGGLTAEEIARGAYIERDYYGRATVRYPGTGGLSTQGLVWLAVVGGLVLFVFARRR